MFPDWFLWLCAALGMLHASLILSSARRALNALADKLRAEADIVEESRSRQEEAVEALKDIAEKGVQIGYGGMEN